MCAHILIYMYLNVSVSVCMKSFGGELWGSLNEMAINMQKTVVLTNKQQHAAWFKSTWQWDMQFHLNAQLHKTST